MNNKATGAAGSEPAPESHQGHHPEGSLAKLAIGAIGIVYGDIGTSPIYAFRETFAGHHHLTPDALHVYGVLSLIFWSMMIIVSLKYLTIVMRADNKGEGGSLALLALINRSLGAERGRKKWTGGDARETRPISRCARGSEQRAVITRPGCADAVLRSTIER